MKRDIALFTGRLAGLLSGGLPLSRSLEVLRQQTRKKNLRDIITRLAGDVEKGCSLSEAMVSCPGFFSPLDLGLLQTGEASGDLAAPLAEIARLQELEIETLARVRHALVYPMALLIMAGVVVLFLTGVVIPRFQGLFDDLGQRLPWPTLVLIQGAVVVRGGFWVAAAVLLVTLLFKGREWKNFQRSFHVQMRRVPWIRDLTQGFFIERWSRIMASLLRHGFNPVEAFELSEKSFISISFTDISQSLYEGQSLADSLSRSPLFPPVVSELLAAGEETNALEEVLERISQSYQRETQARVKTALTLLEPVLIVAMGGVVGFVALAMLLPIFEMSGSLK